MLVSMVLFLLVISICISHCLVWIVSSYIDYAKWEAISRRLHVTTSGINILVILDGPCQCQGCSAF